VSRTVALLRGINVGGKNKLAMADLRACVTGLGWTDVATYVQSGNVVFDTAASGETDPGSTLRGAIKATYGLDIAVVTRSAAEWRAIVDANPFGDPAADDGTKVHVAFTADPIGDLGCAIDVAAFAPEQMQVAEREVYLWLPGGIGRSPLATALTRAGGPPSTVRNWNTVTAIMRMVA
jgi:uncharacterized protein (DUF1697 family)